MKDTDFKFLQEAYQEIYIKESTDLSVEDYLKLIKICKGYTYSYRYYDDECPVGIDEHGKYFALGYEEEREEDKINDWYYVKYFNKDENGEFVSASKWESIDKKEYNHLHNITQNPVEKERKAKWEAEAPEREKQQQEILKKAKEYMEWKRNLSAGDREYYGLPQTKDDIRRHGLR
jgi:hypothetical protein